MDARTAPDKDENKNPCKERSTGEDNRRRPSRRRWHSWSSSSLLSSEIEILKRVLLSFFFCSARWKVETLQGEGLGGPDAFVIHSVEVWFGFHGSKHKALV